MQYSARHLAARIDLRSLQIFVSAVQGGSLSEAAATEHLVVSAVSRRIAALEELFGTPLLERRPGGVVPTAAGRDLIRHAGELKLVLERMDQSLGAHCAGIRGEINLHASTSAMMGTLPSIVAGFMAANAEVQINVKEWDSVQVVRSVENGSAHIGVFSSYVDAAGLETMSHTSTHLAVVASPGHPVCSRQTISFEETLEYDHVVLQDGDTFSALLLHMQDIASRFALPLRVRCRVATFGAACRFIQAGAGIGILPADVAGVFAGPLQLTLVALSDPWAAIRHDVCIQKDAALPTAARHFLECLRPGAQGS